MVYVPWVVAERHMLSKWRESVKENPNQPRPTIVDINIQWFVWLDYYPGSALELERFQQMFRWEDRHEIQFRMLGEFKRQPTKKRPEPTEQPLAEEPKR